MSGIGIMAIILSSIDKFMIPLYLSTEMLGFYSGAYFIVGITKVITGSIITAIVLWFQKKVIIWVMPKKNIFRSWFFLYFCSNWL